MNFSGATFFAMMVGICAACGKGSFLSGPESCLKCPQHCLYCNSTDYCFQCSTGYYGKLCEHDCKDCQPDTNCSKGTGFCLVACKDGFTGKHCDIKCDKRCVSCMRNNATYCLTCKNSQGCNVSCPAHCQGYSCNGRYCPKGCLPGFWGESCQYECPPKCNKGGCNRENGACPEDSEGNPGASRVVVPILLVLLVIIFGIVIFELKRRTRQRDTNTVLYKPQRNSNRNIDNIINLNGNSWISENERLENYANVRRPRNSKNTDRSTKVAYSVVPGESSAVNDSFDTEQTADFNEELDEHCVSEELKIAAKTDVEDTYYNTAALKERRISVQALVEYVNQMSDEDYIKEFEVASLPSVLIKQCNEALREENVLKNRYRGIYPYDVTRVNISCKTSDYINANYIDGYNERRGFIASVGPTIKFMSDMSVFWKVVWHENCRTIVMLTRLIESEVIKCDVYWPDKDCKKSFGNFCITGMEEENFETYAIRTFRMETTQCTSDANEAESRIIRQFHYTVWPDKGVPQSALSLIDLRNAVNGSRSAGDGPVLVHCSAGVGRTGTFIALDILTKEGESTGHVDIYACVRNLREQRVKMVQTLQQYKFLHHALVYSFEKGHSSETLAFSAKL